MFRPWFLEIEAMIRQRGGVHRDPSTGEKKFFGEFLVNAQGEDVVAGIRTPQTIVKLGEIMPRAYEQLEEILSKN